MIVFSLAHERL